MRSNQTPLYQAVTQGKERAVDLLLAQGVRVDVLGQYQSPLSIVRLFHPLSMQGKLRARALDHDVEQGTYVPIQGTHTTDTYLHNAAENGLVLS